MSKELQEEIVRLCGELKEVEAKADKLHKENKELKAGYSKNRLETAIAKAVAKSGGAINPDLVEAVMLDRASLAQDEKRIERVEFTDEAGLLIRDSRGKPVDPAGYLACLKAQPDTSLLFHHAQEKPDHQTQAESNPATGSELEKLHAQRRAMFARMGG